MMKRMVPILGRYGPFFFYSYTAILGSGLLLALGLTRGLARDRVTAAWWHGAVLALAAGLLAGRAGFVASQPGYFSLHPDEVWRIWQGGVSYHVALLAAVGALWFWCRRHRLSFTRLAALLAPGALLWGATGWLACYMEGCAYGRATRLGWLAADLPDSFGVFAVRYQTQLLGAFLFLLLAVIVWRWQRRVPPGPLFWLALALASGSRALVSLWRGDPVPEIGGWRLDTLADSLLALGAAGLFWLANKRRAQRRVKEGDEPESRSGTD
jgi:phosphatidylglycerol:prolipoprotein diacylglycerol transferase